MIRWLMGRGQRRFSYSTSGFKWWISDKRSQIQQRLKCIGPIELAINVIKSLSKGDGAHFAAGVADYAFCPYSHACVSSEPMA
jgi:hypothetical protein